MAKSSNRDSRRIPWAGGALYLAGLAFALRLAVFVREGTPAEPVFEWLQRWFDAPGGSWLRDLALRTLGQILAQAQDAYLAAFLGVTALLGFGAITRVFARTRQLAGQVDPLDAVRERLRRRPWLGAALAGAPGLLWAAFLGYELAGVSGGFLLHEMWTLQTPVTMLIAILLGVVTTGVFAGLGVRSWLAWWLSPVLPPRADAKSDGDIDFAAVPVTPRTRALPWAVGVSSAAVAALVALLPYHTLHSDPRVLAALGAYAALSLGGVLAFRRASRVAIGIDAVHVRRGARTRTFAYRDLDGARPRGAGLELLRGGHPVLHLELHGEDAGRRDEALARVQQAIAHAKKGESRAAISAVQARSTAAVASASRGDAGYRVPIVSREQLWALVEGPEADDAARTAAARALAIELGGAERSRLAEAARRCAEPRLRIALEELVGTGEPPGDDEAVEPARARRTVD